MKYVYIVAGLVHEVIPAINPAFPGIPIEVRYSPEFLADCVAVDEAVEVECNWLYDAETGTFSAPPVPEPIPEPEPEAVEDLTPEAE